MTITGRDAARLESVATTLRRLGAPEVVSVAGDLADPALPDRLVSAHADAYESMSCLVLNAGVGTAGRVADFPTDRLDKTVAVNFRSPFVLLQLCLPLLRCAAGVDPEHGARVVVLSSITGVYAEPGLAVYGATKAALNSLVETVNAEESAGGVTATAIAPGYVATDMSAWARDRVPGEDMIPVNDVVAMVGALVGMSARSVVPRVVISRAGSVGFGA